MLLLPQCMIRSATSRSSQINPSLRLCKVSGAKSAILATGRKTEAFNHKPLPHFLLYWDRMRRAANKTTSLICTYTLAGTAGPAAFPHGKQGRASPAILGDPLATWPWNTTSAWQQRNRHIPPCHPLCHRAIPCATLLCHRQENHGKPGAARRAPRLLHGKPAAQHCTATGARG